MTVLLTGSIPMPTKNTGFVSWFSQLSQYLPTFELPRVYDEKQWVNAAEILLRNPDCTKFNCPWPQGFPDWRSWAQRWVAAFGGQL